MINREAIEQRRKDLKLSMEDAARAAGIGGRQKWNDIVSGRNKNPTISTVLGMAKALRCSIVKIVIQDHLKGRKT